MQPTYQGRALGALIALLLFWPAQVFAQGKGETVRIQDYPGTSNMLFRVAKAKGYCEAHGVKCELQFIASGPLGAQALLAKSIEVGFFPPSVQINAMIKGADLKAFASGAQRNILVVVSSQEAGSPVSSYTDAIRALKGKRIGVPARAAGVELDFLLLAKSADLTAGDFTFVANGSPNTAYTSLISKQVDANATFGPSDVLCEVLKTCTVVYRAFNASGPPEITATHGAAANFVVTGDFISRSPQSIDAMVAALRDAVAFIQNPANFDEAIAIAKSYFKFEMEKGDEILATQLKHVLPSYKGVLSRSALKQIAANMLATGQLEVPFDTTRMIYEKGLIE